MRRRSYCPECGGVALIRRGKPRLCACCDTPMIEQPWPSLIRKRTLWHRAWGQRRVRGTVYVPWATTELLWEPRDLWFGVYWTATPWGPTVYVCVLPCLPLKLSLSKLGRY